MDIRLRIKYKPKQLYGEAIRISYDRLGFFIIWINKGCGHSLITNLFEN